MAQAASLPGVNLPFDVDADGRWRIGAELPEAMAKAGVQAGWVLIAVDDFEVKDGVGARRIVADGNARDLRLRFETERKGETTVVIVRRGRLVVAERAATVPFPAGFTPQGAWLTDDHGRPALRDAGGAQKALDPATGEWVPAPGDTAPNTVPEVFWHVSDDSWVVDKGGSSLDVSASAAARQSFSGAAWVPSYRDNPDDALIVLGSGSVEVFTVRFPRGTPPLPSCSPLVPETCLTSARELVTTLGTREGAVAEARRQLSLACDAGVHRACFESVALDDAALADDARACTEGALDSCQRVSTARLQRDGATATRETLGLLELTCDLEGSGSLSDRLLRIEDVGAGCARLAGAYETSRMPDLALLALDRACVLGRAESCDRASTLRAAAFAARTVRECEDPTNPVGASCVDLGRLLQNGPVAASTLEEFGAFLRGCSLGATDGCTLLGDYVDRWGVTDPRVSAAESQLSQSCESGEMRACLGAGHLLERHEPRSAEYGRALTLFDRACAQGLGEACVAGAEQRRIGQAREVVAPDQATMLSSACDLASPEGCALLGERLVRKSDTVPGAFDAWIKGCDLGEPRACTSLGELVVKPHDPLFPNEQPSAAYLQRGCDDGDPEGCYRLAEPELPKRGEPAEGAYVLLSRSCDGEFGEGCARLADVHLDRGTSFDEEVAARHLDTACRNAHYLSCKDLGQMYQRGRGVERDRTRARELLDQFRRNAPRRYVRLGIQAGLPSAAGGELELVLPIPAPALSIAAGYSYMPFVGTILPLLEGVEDDDPNSPPTGANYRYIGFTARLYPNPRARGLYGFAGTDQVQAKGGYLPAGTTFDRTGWRGGVGLRTDNKYTFVGLEAGVGYYGIVDVQDFDEDSQPGIIPVVQTTFAISFGFAPF